MIHISNRNESYYLRPEDLLYIEADGNYCNIYRTDGDQLGPICMQMGEMARRIRLLREDVRQHFAQVGRGYIVNTEHILRIVPARQVLELDLMQPTTGRRYILHPSVKALQEFRRIMDERYVMFSPSHITINMAANSGFADYAVAEQKLDVMYNVAEEEIDDDSVVFF